MPDAKLRFLGVELYFSNLESARHFYRDTLGLELSEDSPGHHAKFDFKDAFLCLERKGVENYPSRDKALVFFEVEDLQSTIQAIGPHLIIHSEPHPAGNRPAWAVLHDPEGHNILLLQK
jgi:catechol 2,3-dioxygenase-like lactoylglutathione lyase family enzyme